LSGLNPSDILNGFFPYRLKKAIYLGNMPPSKYWEGHLPGLRKEFDPLIIFCVGGLIGAVVATGISISTLTTDLIEKPFQTIEWAERQTGKKFPYYRFDGTNHKRDELNKL
jgi:hypothetical protein